jgi:hypothetical protein
MSLFVKYNDNKTNPNPISGSVLNRNTLFNNTGIVQSSSPPPISNIDTKYSNDVAEIISTRPALNMDTVFTDNVIQSSPSQGVSLGRVESSLFRARQRQDQERINEFLATPGGRSHIDKEIRLARSNPDFGPTSDQKFLDSNPSRTILPRRILSNVGIAGSGIFNSKFGLIGSIGERQGYAKYDLRRKNPNAETDSKLVFLQQKFHPLQPSESGFGETRLGRFLTGISSALSDASSFLTRGIPAKKILYEYSGGPGSDNGIGLTTIYRHQPLIERKTTTDYYRIKNDLNIFNQEGRSSKSERLDNYTSNIFWNHTFGIGIGNVSNSERSRFVIERVSNAFNSSTQTVELNYRSNFQSEYKFIKDEFYTIKKDLSVNTQSRRSNLKNYKINKFWNAGTFGSDIGNIENFDSIIRPSRFVDNDLSSSFQSEFTSSFNESRFITSGLPETNEYKEGKFNKSPISDYYETKDIRLYNGLKQEGTKSLPNFKSITTGSLNSYYDSGSLLNKPDFTDVFYKDLIDFKLEIIDLETPNKSYYLYFKPFIESFTDDYTPTYETLSYPGNPSGKIFKYQNFNRTLSMSFKIALFSKSEHEGIYKKLNRLVSTTLPTIQNGTIRSTITKLTVGNWCKRLPGVVTGINFSNLFENPWDIDEETPQVINVNLNYQYSSTYGDDVVVSSSPTLYNSFSIGGINAT